MKIHPLTQSVRRARFLLRAGEFRHAFGAEQDRRAEFDAGGFETLYLTVFDGMMRGGAGLVKLA